MSRPVEKVTLAVILASLGLGIALWTPVLDIFSNGTTTTPTPVTTTVRPATTTSISPDTTLVSTTTTSVTTTAAIAATTTAATGPIPETTEVAATTTAQATTTSTAPSTTTAAPTTTRAPSTTTRPPPSTTTSTTPSTTMPPTTVAAGPGRCAPIEDLWRLGYPVEDSCTLAEVRRVLTWAWAGTDAQRRAAIRNSYLLEDEVFPALDDFGLNDPNGSGFHPEERRQRRLVVNSVIWKGGPEASDGVAAVWFYFDHPDYPRNSEFPFHQTLVQVDGEWKLSYRRSFCVLARLVLELSGSDVLCPRDPHPEINEDEAKGLGYVY